jgi:hypothetical protein
MSAIFWKVLRISPAFLGASLLVASSSYAAQNVPNQAVTPAGEATTTVEPTVAPLAQSQPIVASSTPATESVPDQAAAIAKPTVESLVQQPQIALESSSQLTPTGVNPAPNTLAQQVPAADNQNTDSNQALEQINRYSTDSDPLDQVTNVSQLRDVSPGDWAFEALRSLVERYGCIAGYPDGTFRGNRATSRYEFAAGLNACLNQVERLIQTSTADFVRKSDLETLQRLVTEFRTELTTLGARVDKLEGRTAFLENRQFSTTTKLNGEAIFAISDLFGDQNRNGNDYARTETVFQDRVRLTLDTSFTGKDLLRTRLQAGNITEFGPLAGAGSVTREGRFGFQVDNGNSVSLDRLFYQTPLTDAVRLYLAANAGQYRDYVPLLNGNLVSSGTGALSRFGRYNPIYRISGTSAGAGLTIGPKSPIRIDLGYFAGGNASNPGEDAGLFNGGYSALGQVTFQPAKQFALSATYIHSYSTNPDSLVGNAALGGSLGHGTGSIASQISNTFRPVVGNSFGVGASFSFTPQFVLSGWAGYTEAIVLQAGRADVWNFAATLALNDFGTKGSTLGLIFGMEPKLTGTSNARVASLISGGSLPVGARRDQDTGFHVEGFYKFNVTRNIAITPGVIWLTAPGHNENNDDIVIGTVRTTFTF